MDERSIKQKVDDALQVLRDHMELDGAKYGNEWCVLISKDDLALLADAFKDLVDLTDTLDVCDFCSMPCIGQRYERQVCCENYYDHWTL